MTASISEHFKRRSPSAIRQAQILFAERPDAAEVRVINLAIGNVSLPMHPAMRKRLAAIGQSGEAFGDGVVKYSQTVGSLEARRAVLRIIESAGVDTTGLHALVTDGGSQAMELMVLGTCGPGSERPLLLLDPAYSNYVDMARRAHVPTISAMRVLDAQGRFQGPALEALEEQILRERPAALVVIPADNPTGQFLTQDDLVEIARLCVKHGLWIVSDEAYRQLQYDSDEASSVWRISEAEVPGITGRRISIESASKVWNACGLRIGALVTDNLEFHQRAVAEYTANLCSNVIGQHIFGALAELSVEELQSWYREQKQFYRSLMSRVREQLMARLPGIIISRPEAALYSVIDLRNLVPESFDAARFVRRCAAEGRVSLEGQPHTLLLAPLGGFYNQRGAHGRSQMRMAFVEPASEMEKVPELFAALFEEFRESC